MINVDFDDAIPAGRVEAIVCEIEKEAHARWPQVRRLFIRPLQNAAEQLED
jgi:hypothetical protein